MQFRRIATSLFAFTCFLGAQTTISRSSGSGIIGSGSGNLNVSGDVASSASFGTVTMDSTGRMVIWSDSSTGHLVQSGAWTGGGVPAETRIGKGPALTVQIVDQGAHRIPHARLASANYIKLARHIGLDPSPSLDEARLMDAIDKLGIRIYDFATVDEYLYRQAQKQQAHTRWVWKPMRKKDQDAVDNDKDCSGCTWRTMPQAGFVYPAMYSQNIPERVLERAGAILEEIPEALLMVSDYEVIRPDPFLAVTTPRLLSAGKLFIIDRWDEPGFNDVDGTGLLSLRR